MKARAVALNGKREVVSEGYEVKANEPFDVVEKAVEALEEMMAKECKYGFAFIEIRVAS